jgi:general secretion pathway protein G
MLVIVILGILAGVAVTQFTGVGQDARIARAQTDIENIKMALRMFELEMGRFPSDDEGIEELTMKTDEHKRCLEKLPKDPWGELYNYRAESENEMDFPDVWSNGPDKTEGTEDDVVSWQVEDEGGTEGGGTTSSSSAPAGNE